MSSDDIPCTNGPLGVAGDHDEFTYCPKHDAGHDTLGRLLSERKPLESEQPLHLAGVSLAMARALQRALALVRVPQEQWTDDDRATLALVGRAIEERLKK